MKSAKEKWAIQCKGILDLLTKQPDAGPFLIPVNYEALGLMDYPKIVKQPMDIGTVKKRLDRNDYRSASEFAADVRLIWSNCKLYNQEGSEFYLVADNFSKLFEENFKDVERGDNNELPSLSIKSEFSKSIYLLSGENLGRIVHVLSTSCEKALNQLSPDEMEILVDEIDPDTFWELDSFVKKNLPEAKGSSVKKTKKPVEELSGTKSKKVKY